MAIGFTWNLLMIAAIFKFKLHKNPTYMFLLNLVVSDFLWCILVVLIDAIAEGSEEFIFGQSDYQRCYFCRAENVVIYSLTNVSIASLALISLDRLVYLQWPLRYKHIVTSRNVLVALTVSWILSVLCASPLLLNLGGEVRIFDNVYCKLDLPRSIPYTIMLFGWMVPMWLIVVLSNAWILLITYKNRKARLSRQLRHSRVSESQEHMRKYYRDQLLVTKAFGGIVAVSSFLWILVAALLVAASLVEGEALEIVTSALHMVDYMLPIIHPLIETCLIPKGRQLVWKAFCSCWKKKNAMPAKSDVCLT